MRTTAIAVATFFLILSPLACSKSPKPNGVIIVSIDGGKPAAIEKASMPEWKKIIPEGAISWRAQTVFPSLTLPAHVSMLSGISPDKHKMKWNDWEEGKGMVTFPTIFSLAKAEGLKTALFATKAKFKHFDVPGSFDLFSYNEAKAVRTSEIAVDYLKTTPTELVFIHLRDADLAGHAHGWESPEQLKALTEIDTALKNIIHYIKDPGTMVEYTLIVTADHGGTEKGHGSASAEDMTIPWFVWGKGVKKGTLKSEISTVDTAATALHLLNIKPPKDWQGHVVSEAFNPN